MKKTRVMLTSNNVKVGKNNSKVLSTKDFLTTIITNNSEAGRVTLWTMDDKTLKYPQENSISIDVFLLVLERRRLFSLVIVHMLIKY